MLFKFPPKLGSRTGMTKYIENDLWMWFRDLSVGLLKLTFLENFDSFKVENITIPPGQEVAIPNQFKTRGNGDVPTSRIIVRQKGNGVVTDGQQWNTNLVYLFNNGAVDVIVSVIFFK